MPVFVSPMPKGCSGVSFSQNRTMSEVERTEAMNRRSFLWGAAALLGGTSRLAASQNAPMHVPDTSALKRAARQSGKILGMYVVGHDLEFDPTASAIIADTFTMIADGNDLKFANRLRP